MSISKRIERLEALSGGDWNPPIIALKKENSYFVSYNGEEKTMTPEQLEALQRETQAETMILESKGLEPDVL